MALTIGSTDDQSNRMIRALLYGDSGIGKTTSARTLRPESSLIVGFENKMLPLAGLGYTTATIRSWDDLIELHDMFKDGSVQIEGREIKTLFVDSLTAMGELAKRAIVQKYRPELMLRKSKGKIDTPDGIYDDQLDMKDWGKFNSMMQWAIVSFTALPVNVIMTALAQPMGADEEGRKIMLDGKVGKMAPSYFDLVFFMRELPGDDRGRVFQTAKGGDCYAKDATGFLDKYEDTDWQHIMRTIYTRSTSTKTAKGDDA